MWGFPSGWSLRIEMAQISFVNNLKNVVRSKIALYKLNCDRNCDYVNLKSHQYDGLMACYHGDAMIVLKTGCGKSLIYEIFPYFHEVCAMDVGFAVIQKCVVLVLTPLNSIVEDRMQKLGHRCFHINSDVRKMLQQDVSSVHTDVRLQLEKFINCGYMYVVGLPEDFLRDVMWPILKNKSWQTCKCVIVVDEGHCVVQWRTFRPKYDKISELRTLLPESSVTVMTATASNGMQASITSSLMLISPKLVIGSVDRHNIYLNVRHIARNRMSAEELFSSWIEPVFDDFQNHPESFGKTIVYCKLHYVGLGYEKAIIRGAGLEAHVGMYHAHLPEEVCIWEYL